MTIKQIKTVERIFPDGSKLEIIDTDGEVSCFASVEKFPGGEAVHFLNRIEGHGEASEDDKKIYVMMLDALKKKKAEEVEVLDPWAGKANFSLLGQA